MNDANLLTYWISLESLDDEHATFGSRTKEIRVESSIPRKTWEGMKRPGHIEITPKPDTRGNQ